MVFKNIAEEHILMEERSFRRLMRQYSENTYNRYLPSNNIGVLKSGILRQKVYV
jgi:hypothetical protein